MELVVQKATIEQLEGEFAFSERRACGLLLLAVGTYRYQPRRNDEPLRERLVQLARERPRFGYRRLHVLLGREGTAVNHKRVHRLYRECGLMIRRKKRKHCVREGQPLASRSAPNQEWALDFIHDSLESGRKVRLLVVSDAYTREALALEADTSFAGRRVTRVLEQIAAERGLPQAIRCDNGPELTSRYFLSWCVARQVDMLHIPPGRPTQNGRLESLNGRVRDEFLNVSLFVNLFDLRRRAEAWRSDYNEVRPHSSLAYQTPAAFAAKYGGAGRGKDAPLERGLENPAGFPLSHRPTTTAFTLGAPVKTSASSTVA